MENEIRYSIFDNTTDELIGYKADSFWTAHPKVFKSHSTTEGHFEDVLLPNLLHMLNNYSSGEDLELRIQREEFDFIKNKNPLGGKVEDTVTLESTPIYVVQKNEEGVYSATPVN